MDTPEEKREDQFERFAMGIVVFVLLLILAVFGVGIWGFIQFIQWLTSK